MSIGSRTAHHLFSAAQRYVTSSMTLRDIGRQLAVEYLLAGSRALDLLLH